MSKQDALTRDFVVSTLTAERSGHLDIADPAEYAAKVLGHGRNLSLWDGSSIPMAYVLYYDNEPTVFVTLVWTRPDVRQQGLARQLLRDLSAGTNKRVRLEVAADGSARRVYEGLGFSQTGTRGDSVEVERGRTVAIMQPYLFPYLPYFQLIDSADVLVSLDDVNYIRRGWINRNNILLNGQSHLFTLPVLDASQNSVIRSVRTADDPRWLSAFLASLQQGYAGPAFKDETIDLVRRSLRGLGSQSIADVALTSVREVLAYVGVSKDIRTASSLSGGHSGARREARLIEITRSLAGDCYVNAAGGSALYNPADFRSEGLTLKFVDSIDVVYPQGGQHFVPHLSIIDVLMHNSPAEVRRLMAWYQLRRPA